MERGSLAPKAIRGYSALVPGPLSRYAAILGISAALTASASGVVQQAPGRVARIQARGVLGCGIEPAVPGFAERDDQGRYRGLDIDICRAVAAALFGTPDRIHYLPAASVTAFRQNDAIDVVSRRLTWELRREGDEKLLFGPVTFYDGQGFLVLKALGVTAARQLAGQSVCVAGGDVFERNLNEYMRRESLVVRKTTLESPHDYDAIAGRLASGSCRAYSGDESDLGAIRSRLPHPDEFAILPDRISEEPLAPLVRREDGDLFAILRWTVYALIAAEELGVTSRNVEAMRQSADLDVRRLLGVMPGNGRALDLDERWAANAIKAVGNYGEMFERNLGRDSPIKLDRGRNRLFRDGGLMYAPPLR
jgi:general L-amino acid transport system substrate-binding protein